MADILIRGMEMPEYCYECPCHNGESGYCQAYKSGYLNSIERPAKCPLLPLTAGHGRLGDLDALKDAFIRYYLSQERSNHLVFTPVEIKQHFADMMGDWPTIVPAEGGTDDGF